jgi:hypothetical protein
MNETKRRDLLDMFQKTSVEVDSDLSFRVTESCGNLVIELPGGGPSPPYFSGSVGAIGGRTSS